MLQLREQKAQRKKELIQERHKLRRAKAAYRADNGDIIRELQYRLSDLNVEIEEKRQHLARVRNDDCDDTLLQKINETETQLAQIADATDVVLDEYHEWQWRAGVLQQGLEQERASGSFEKPPSPPESVALSKAIEELRTVYKLRGQARVLREERDNPKVTAAAVRREPGACD